MVTVAETDPGQRPGGVGGLGGVTHQAAEGAEWAGRAHPAR